MNRDELQAAYVSWLLANTSQDELEQFFIDSVNDDLNGLDDDECIAEIRSFMKEDA